MMRCLSKLKRDEKGLSAVEFAFIAPVLLTFLVGLAQLGTLYFANTGLKSAVGEGARLATLFRATPLRRPSNDEIIARIRDRQFGLDPAYITAPTVTPATTAQIAANNGRNFLDIQMSYEVRLDFIFFQTSPITITERRRAFVHS
jgi:Flp pilus assembly protein TadG